MKINVNGTDVEIGDIFIVINDGDVAEISGTGLLVGGYVHVIDCHPEGADASDLVDIQCTDGDSFRAIHNVADIKAATVVPPPHQAAAKAKGWVTGGGYIYHRDHFDSWKEAVSWSGTEGHEDHPLYDSWKECCEAEDIEVQEAANG